MSRTKSPASLTPTLLARKGGAKPAMRPQLQPLHEFHEATARAMADDLGWNDLGLDPVVNEPRREGGAEVVPIAGDAPARMADAERPSVVNQQSALMAQFSSPAAPRKSALAQGRRAAFTLRLDADRHLKLRLASTVLDRSAQDIVTEALDNHLATLADLEAIAAQIRKRR